MVSVQVINSDLSAESTYFLKMSHVYSLYYPKLSVEMVNSGSVEGTLSASLVTADVHYKQKTAKSKDFIVNEERQTTCIIRTQ